MVRGSLDKLRQTPLGVHMVFPENRLNLTRGTVLEATHTAVGSLGLKPGDRIVIGYDGTYVRFRHFTWSVDQIVSEIEELGYWEVVGTMDLSKPSVERFFAQTFECRRD